jgi:sugar phosphate isomerase/epimerase
VSAVVRVPRAKVALSTASCYPESCTAAFEMAGRLGYDGVEVMVWTDAVSQDPEALRRLADHYAVPVLALHAPTLLLSQRVWGAEPWGKLARAKEVAEAVGASTVVLHPPFRWQRDYASGFAEGVALLGEDSDVAFAVENMFPWRAGGREVAAYLPGWNSAEGDYANLCLDLSHAATAQVDGLELLEQMGERMSHLHLADGSGSSRDEHLVPGRGTQPCAAVLERLARDGYTGTVVLEINTRRAQDREERERDLAQSLAFTRLNLAAPRLQVWPDPAQRDDR